MTPQNCITYTDRFSDCANTFVKSTTCVRTGRQGVEQSRVIDVFHLYKFDKFQSLAATFHVCDISFSGPQDWHDVGIRRVTSRQ